MLRKIVNLTVNVSSGDELDPRTDSILIRGIKVRSKSPAVLVAQLQKAYLPRVRGPCASRCLKAPSK